MRRFLVAVTALACTQASSLPAQARSQADTIPLGTSIRLGFTSGDVVRGRLAAPFATGTTDIVYCRFPSVVCPPADTSLLVTQPTADLVRLEVRSGNALKGGLIGGAAVIAFALIARELFAFGERPRLDAARVAGFFTFVGAGAFAGTRIASGWAEVSIEPAAP